MPRRKTAPDFLLLVAIMGLICIGLLMVFSSSAYASMISMDDRYYFLKRQAVWVVIGLVGFLTASRYDYYRLRRHSEAFLGLSLLLLGAVLAIGLRSHGAVRSLGVGILTFQPSEVIKLAMVIFLAKTLSERQERIKSFRQGVLPVLVLLAVVGALIMVQPDLGTTVAVAGTTYLLLLAAGAQVSHLLGLAVTGIAAVAALILAAPYRMERFTAFLNPYADPGDSGFQIIQALLALGSGGLFGLGLGNGRQKMLYIPERHTDFIFAIIGEELGFLGAALVLALFFLLIWRGLKTAVTAPDSFGMLLAAGLTTMVALQAIINIGVVTGSLPVTGITLPFLSYGGSSLVFSMLGMGILFNISRYARE